jgi:hypothetical protein
MDTDTLHRLAEIVRQIEDSFGKPRIAQFIESSEGYGVIALEIKFHKLDKEDP